MGSTGFRVGPFNWVVSRGCIEFLRGVGVQGLQFGIFRLSVFG